MFRTKRAFSFTELLGQYRPGNYLVETKRGPEFRAPGWKPFRCFEHTFMGTTFEIEKSAPSLLKRAKDFLKNEGCSLEELESLTKVLFYTKRIFYGVELYRGTVTKNFQKLYDEEKALAKKALHALAQKRKLSEVQLCLELGATNDALLEEAYSRLRATRNEKALFDSFKNFPERYLNLLAGLSLRKRDYELLLHVLALGGKPPTSTIEEERDLLSFALNQFNDNALATLIQAGYRWDFCLKIPHQHFIFCCLEQGMTRTIEAIVAQKTPLNMRDSEGNTPLHYAFYQGNAQLVRELSKVIDPTIKNGQNQTPLAALLNPIDSVAESFSHYVDRGIFFKEFFANDAAAASVEKIEPSLFRRIAEEIIGCPLYQFCDPVELVFLAGANRASAYLFQNMMREQVDNACKTLRSKYPKSAVDPFFLSSFSVNEAHFSTGQELATLPEEHESDADPSHLLNLLDQIKGFSWIDRQKLARFLTMVKTRADNIGTHEQTRSEKEYFYKQIEDNLKHIVVSLKQKKDPDMTREALIELVDASSNCIGRHYATSLTVAQKVCLGLKMTPLLLLQRSLGCFRSLCLEHAVDEVYPGDTHNANKYTAALRDLGKTLGIPGLPADTLDDRCSPSSLSFHSEEVRRHFMNLYTPKAIVFEWLLPKLKDEIEFRNGYVELLKEHVPHNWTISDASSEQSDAEKAYDFLEKSMYDEGNQLQISTLCYLLEKLGIIQSITFKESSRVTRSRKSK